MNENAKKWVEALRSGEYKQARGALTRKRNGDVSHCCLGVACDLYAKENELDIEEAKRTSEGVVISYGGTTGYLPERVREWLGLRDFCGAFDAINSLASRNDSGATFNEIANIIESEPEGLFI